MLNDVLNDTLVVVRKSHILYICVHRINFFFLGDGGGERGIEYHVSCLGLRGADWELRIASPGTKKAACKYIAWMTTIIIL